MLARYGLVADFIVVIIASDAAEYGLHYNWNLVLVGTWNSRGITIRLWNLNTETSVHQIGVII